MKKMIKLVLFSFAMLLNGCASGYKKINPETITHQKY
jgi:starvation-inducible outer membrane lipoprotein